MLVSLVVGAVSLLLRFRRARGVERLQLRWLAWGAAIAAVALLVAMARPCSWSRTSTLLNVALGISAAVLPLATGAAILRYRLYDLDRIISRTLAYGLLTVLLGLGYAAVVLGLGRLLPESSSLVVAAATLAVAAVFQPRAAASRRWSTAASTATATTPPGPSPPSAARLRDQVDLTTLTDELLAVVDQTMQPTRASLWLRASGPRG